jgi:hypothetical protein
VNRLIIVCCLGLVRLTVFAQSELTILHREKLIGKSYLTNKEILAREFIFPERIADTYIDTISSSITVQLRGTSRNGKWLNNSGDIILYNLEQMRTKWSKTIGYQQSSIEQNGSVIIETVGKKSYCLDYENGKNKWEVKNAIYYVEPVQKKGIGYNYSDWASDEKNMTNLEGIDLTNGNKIWKRELTRKYSWNDVFHLDDSTIIVVAGGLHSINVSNGSGWDYNTVTGAFDYSGTAAANVAGAALGLLTGVFAMSTGHDLVRDVVSNVLVDSSDMYFASKEKIARLDLKGLVKWSVDLPKDKTSKSSIFKNDSVLYMLNKGYAFMGYRQLNYGTPFFAAFDLKTGKQIFLNTMQGKDEPVNGFEVNKDNVVLVFKNKLIRYSLSDGSKILEKEFDTKVYGELNNFIGSQVYTETDSLYTSLSSDTTKNFVYTKDKKTIILNDKFEVVDQIDHDKLYIYYLYDNGYKFLAKDGKTTVIDSSNKAVANIDISSKSIKIGSKIYNVQEKSFIEIDLNNIMKN